MKTPPVPDRRPAAAMVLILILLAPGCAGPGIHQRRWVSQPDMVFSEGSVWNFDQPLSVQTESGRAFAGFGSAAGCTSCR